MIFDFYTERGKKKENMAGSDELIKKDIVDSRRYRQEHTGSGRDRERPCFNQIK